MTAEEKYEKCMHLTPEELATLSPSLQQAYKDDQAEEAKHQELMSFDIDPDIAKLLNA